MTQAVQRSMTARLLRRALETSLPPNPLGLVDAVANRLADVLPKDREATLLLRDSGRDRRCPRYPSTRLFNPYEELFTFRRVVTPPWDKVWRSTPLVLHDVDLLQAVDFPPFLEAEPHDQVENVAKILENHDGPVNSLRLDASRLPPPEMLGRFLDLLSTRVLKELVLLDVAAPRARDKKALDFPLGRLRCPDLATLALGFVDVRFGLCSGLSGLEVLFLVCCQCSGRDLSDAVANLDRLVKLGIFGVDLATAGAGATSSSSGDGALQITSDSLETLELMEATATALTLLYAPTLKTLVAGVMPPEVKNYRVIGPRPETANPPTRVTVQHAEELQTISGLVLWGPQRISFRPELLKMDTIEVALKMAVAEQWSQLLKLASQLPWLRCLKLTRVDACNGDEKVELELPECFRQSLRELHLLSYRAGAAEVTLVNTILANSLQLLCVFLYPHMSLRDPGFAHIEFLRCPRLCSAARVEVCQSGW